MNDDAQRGSDYHDDWSRLLLQLGHSDIRWAKEQGWRVVNWTLLLLGALVALRELPDARLPLSLSVLAGVISTVAVIWLYELHQFAADSRKNCTKIRRKVLTADTDHPLCQLDVFQGDHDHKFYLGVQIAVISAAWLLLVLTFN